MIQSKSIKKKPVRADFAKLLLPYLKNKSIYFQHQKNNFYKNYVKCEAVLQLFIVNILRENGYTVIVNMKEGKKTPFEQFYFKFMGNVRFRSDLFVTSTKTCNKGAWLELKDFEDKVYTKKGFYKKNVQIDGQSKFLEEINRQGFYADFVYFENVINLLENVFGCKKV